MFLLFVPFVWVGLCSEVLGLRVALRCGLCRQFERGRQKRQGEAEREKCAAAQQDDDLFASGQPFFRR